MPPWRSLVPTIEMTIGDDEEPALVGWSTGRVVRSGAHATCTAIRSHRPAGTRVDIVGPKLRAIRRPQFTEALRAEEARRQFCPRHDIEASRRGFRPIFAVDG